VSEKKTKELKFYIQEIAGRPQRHVVKKRGEIVCWATVEFTPKGDSGALGLVWICTLPEHRKKGYALKLIDKMKTKFDFIYTEWATSTEEGKAVCMKAGMVRSSVPNKTGGFLELLVWKNPKTHIIDFSKINGKGLNANK